MILDFLGEPRTLVVTGKYAKLKDDSERFARRSVPRGVDHILAHRRS